MVKREPKPKPKPRMNHRVGKDHKSSPSQESDLTMSSLDPPSPSVIPTSPELFAKSNEMHVKKLFSSESRAFDAYLQSQSRKRQLMSRQIRASVR